MNRRTHYLSTHIFIALIVFLVCLPFLTTFSEQLTGMLQKTPLSLSIQNILVPYEVQLVSAVLYVLGMPVQTAQDFITVHGQPLLVTWNCVGWQSLLFLLVSFMIGLQGNFTRTSKVITLSIGILGTFWMNIIRIVIICLLGGYFPSIYEFVFHTYLATAMTLIWLFCFWWFVYQYVLEEKQSSQRAT